MPGIGTLEAEVTNISAHGLWLLIDGEELAMSFLDFPWLKKATIEQLTALERPTPDHLHWPLLDVDLSVESLRNPSAFPLVSKLS